MFMIKVTDGWRNAALVGTAHCDAMLRGTALTGAAR